MNAPSPTQQAAALAAHARYIHALTAKYRELANRYADAVDAGNLPSAYVIRGQLGRYQELLDTEPARGATRYGVDTWRRALTATNTGHQPR